MKTQFISDPIKKVNELASVSQRKVAAIAYVTKDHARFCDSDIVICDASDGAIKSRTTCRDLLRQWCDAGVKVYSKHDLHAKMIVFDHKSAFVGSANFSEFAERRVESGIFTSEPIVVAQCERFILNLVKRSDVVDEEFLKRIDGLKLQPKRPRQPANKNSSNSTLRYWFFKGTTGHSKRSLAAETELRAAWDADATEATTEDYDDEIPEEENPLSLVGLSQTSPRWTAGVSKGDRVFWCYDHEDYGWIVLPPRTVMSIANRGKSVMAGTEGRYWDEENSIRLDVFIKRLGLRKNVSLDAISPSNPELPQLLHDWDDLVD